jgi:protocatechuate 3,4-dioxygenase beta subunit
MKRQWMALMVAAGLVAMPPSGALENCAVSGQKSHANWPPRPAPAVTVSGQVIDPAGRPAPEATIILSLREPDTGARTPSQSTAQTDTQGKFTIPGVLPGSYLLSATWRQEFKEFWSQKRIEVVDSNVTGVQLQLRGALNLTGRVSTSDKTAIDFERLTVEISPEDGDGPDGTADVEKDGTFALQKIRPTTYLLQLSGLPEGWYTHSAVLGEKDVLNNGIDLADETAGGRLEITAGPGACRVEGVVTEAEFHDVVPGAVVKLLPDPATPRRADLLRTALTNQFGEFTIRNVVPGQYRVLAVMIRGSGEGVTVGRDSYADNMIARNAGVRVVLAEKQSKHLELELFEAYR